LRQKAVSKALPRLATALDRLTGGLRRDLGSTGLPPYAAVLRMALGAWVAQALYVAARLGIADHLNAGPKTADELAAATGAQPRELYRVLRALASVGVFAEGEDGRFRMTRLSDGLRSDVPKSARWMLIMLGDEWHWRPWGHLLHSVQTGEPAVEHVFGMDTFAYMRQDPEAAAVFNRAMTVQVSVSHAEVIAAYNFAKFGTIVDVGGGYGALIAAILKVHPQVRGILFDQPHVIEETRCRLAQAGLADRCEAIGGDFFEGVPPGGDAYVCSTVIHDWDDERAIAILKRCREVMPPHGRMLLLESVVAPGNLPSLGKLLDLEMMVQTGGQERTEAEYGALFAAAGFRLTRVVPTLSQTSLLEGVPV
jgi:hypothetical protein